MCAKSASRLCECCAPSRTPPPDTIRITSGIVALPPIMNRSFAAWFTIWSKATVAKSENWSPDHGAQAGERGADPAPDEAALGQRRVPDPPRAVALEQALRRAEDAADPTDVLAHDDHVRIRGEFEVEGLADRCDEAERPVALGRWDGMA